MNNDLISRKELLELYEGLENQELKVPVEVVVQNIKDMPTVEPMKWIACSERLPNKEEYIKHDGIFIVTDGNRTYEGLFDIYDGLFKKDCFGCALERDECVIAWQPLPEPYKGE